MSTYKKPVLTRYSDTDPNTDVVTVHLADLEGGLKFRIPDLDKIGYEWEVAPVLGSEPVEWADRKSLSSYDDEGNAQKLTVLELTVPKARLEKYRGQVVELRYRYFSESDDYGDDMLSAPVRLKVE
ncbi:hypothetical protein LOY67_04085 [Pseudomonas sp. B21-056]|jgi:hypothetical protein|uniref:hypothetical protein n=1 Tax=Pseudomonas sp. B21-056 TaxID=2895495 RepID=UPI002231F4FB|nr:hypothetical protein [Pseudomonas sp. B21-056]UZE24600.1 hypothetical protein LOY67_04085 [Pseudomonas sp. B21-056]